MDVIIVIVSEMGKRKYSLANRAVIFNPETAMIKSLQ